MTSPVLDDFRDFSCGDVSLFEAMDALMAYDLGAWDSGDGDENTREVVKAYLARLEDDRLRRACAVFARRYLTDEAIAEGYGINDVGEFAEWVDGFLD
jgi:hypothetical protein